VVEREMDVYVVEADRRVAYLQELYLVEAARGIGAGRALMAACEDWARAHKIPVMHIGVVAGNTRAHDIYKAAGFVDYAVDLRKYL
jgi:GNAT superfamily N-acetyltransferase